MRKLIEALIDGREADIVQLRKDEKELKTEYAKGMNSGLILAKIHEISTLNYLLKTFENGTSTRN